MNYAKALAAATYIVNGTMLLSMDPQSYPGYVAVNLYPFIDVGNGTISGAAVAFSEMGYSGSLSIMDCQFYYYNLAIGLQIVDECKQSPQPSVYSSGSVGYNLQSILNTYGPGMPAWGASLGDTIAELLMDIAELTELSPFAGFALSSILSYYKPSASSLYLNVGVNIKTNSSRLWSFYTAFIDSPVYEEQGINSYNPFGIIMNSSNYYLYGSMGNRCLGL